MNALKITLHLLEPLLATQPNAGEANSAVSYDFIPGSMLRGAFVRAYLQNNPGVDVSASARDLFFDGTVRFLNAYRAAPGDGRMLPTPLSWFVDKDAVEQKDAEIFDFAVALNPSIEKPKRPKGEFCFLTNGKALLENPKRHITVHNASDERGRKRAGASQVFRYDALAENQTFQGVVISANRVLLETLRDCIGTTIFLGGSHTGGYGPVTVECELEENWQEYQPVAASDLAIVTLLSDVILPPHNNSILEALASALGVAAAQISDAYYDVRLVGGFNRVWGLPLPQSWAIQAGSVFKFNSALNPAVFSGGIGDRVVEGFGRVALNLHVAPSIKRIPTLANTSASGSNQPPTLAPDSEKQAINMANRLLKILLERKLTELLAADIKFSELPSASQLNRIRMVARQSMLTKKPAEVKKHFDDLKSAKKTWERAKIRGQSLMDWAIHHSAMKEDQFRSAFKLTNDLPVVAGRRAALNQTLINEFCARYIDGVMKLAVEHQRAQEGR